MAWDNSNDGGKNDKRGEMRVPPRTWILWIAILGAIPLLMMLRDRTEVRARTISLGELVAAVDSNKVDSATITYSPQSPLKDIRGQFTEKTADGRPVHFQIKTSLTPELEQKLLLTRAFRVAEPNTLLLNVLYTLLPFALLAGLI